MTKTTQTPPVRRVLRIGLLVLIGAVAATVLAINPAIAESEPAWAFEATFDGDPSAPSQDLLPRDFEYVVTHRTHPQEHFTRAFEPFPADHAEDCAGPNPEVSPLPQHWVTTDAKSNSVDPDESFFICKNHMMSSMGEVGPYSIGAFWPRQEFDFSDGGTLEWEVNVNLGHENRSWWEVMIVPADQLKVAAGPTDSAIDETYPEERIVLDFRRLTRRVKVGTGELAPAGWLANEREFLQYDWAYWNEKHPEDPAVNDRRVRRTMRVQLEDDQIVWGIELEDGSFDEFVVDVPGGLPFDRGLVVFKTHAYTPSKNNNTDTFTFHWDNIRFDGPVVGQYESHYADDVVYLQRNGDRPIGDSATVNISLDEIGENPRLFGQVHQHKAGQVELSINGGPTIEVNPFEYDPDGCPNGDWNDWKSFLLPLDPSQLVEGTNTFTWTVGERPACSGGPLLWDGFSVKSLHIQTDGQASSAPPSTTTSTAPINSVPSTTTTAAPTTTVAPPTTVIDQPTCGGQVATIVGTSGDDTILGTEAADVIITGGGNDVVFGKGGNDLVCTKPDA